MNAYQVFINCSRYLQRTEDETKWKEYVTNWDYRLVQKGRFGIDTRTCWFVVETQVDFDRLSVLHPDRVLLVDQSYIQDTQGEKALGPSVQLPALRRESHQHTMPLFSVAQGKDYPRDQVAEGGQGGCAFPLRRSKEGRSEKLCKDNDLHMSGNMAQIISRLIATDVQQ